jgi:hypothetical protein
VRFRVRFQYGQLSFEIGVRQRVDVLLEKGVDRRAVGCGVVVVAFALGTDGCGVGALLDLTVPRAGCVDELAFPIKRRRLPDFFELKVFNRIGLAIMKD